jgi:hypothetical protein
LPKYFSLKINRQIVRDNTAKTGIEKCDAGHVISWKFMPYFVVQSKKTDSKLNLKTQVSSHIKRLATADKEHH